MAKGRISEDQLRYTIDVNSSKAQQEIRKMEFEIDGLRRKNKDLTAEMVRLEAQGEKNSKEWRYAHALYLKNNKTIKALTSSIAEQTKKIGVNYMTMNQLKKQAKQLQRQLDDTSKAISPERYYELEQRLKAINDRMIALRRSAKDMIEELRSEANAIRISTSEIDYMYRCGNTE